MKIVKIANRIIINRSHYNNSIKVTKYAKNRTSNIRYNDLAHIWPIEIKTCILCMHALNYFPNFFLKKCLLFSNAELEKLSLKLQYEESLSRRFLASTLFPFCTALYHVIVAHYNCKQ